ncbi:Cuticular protein RR-2 motif 91 [Operophtera brumata]|uniref:Cuticular protein RR-2 motif 91 n=1 Tax=Operophtera brumata TaxID=104452 RepID=A0A0L7LNM5_OPEBR|nr:Cuticular protein RR-2 motif 91 [Operophtera brumata]
MISKVAVILSVVAVATAGVIHGYGGESYDHEQLQYAPVEHAPVSYQGHEDTHVDYHLIYL